MRCFLISTLLCASTQTALADRKISAAALVELERGEAHFRDKDYAAAIAAFDAGYAIDPQPIFLYDKAQAQRLSGDCRSAIGTYNEFIDTGPPATEVARARKNVASCESQLPPPEPKPASPRAGALVTRGPTVVDSEPSPVEPMPVRTPELAVRERQSWWNDGIGVTLVTAGMIGLGAGATFAVAARGAAKDSALATNVDDWVDSQQRYDRNRTISFVAVGGGAALLTLGVLRLSLRDRNVQLAPANGHGALVSLGGAW
jgi:hypothetical protein